MNRDDAKYSTFALVQEMMDTIDVVRGFDHAQAEAVAKKVKAAGRLLMVGEGSSRIFPAKNAIRKALTWGADTVLQTEGSRQAAQYDLSKYAVFCASNSGRTKEVIALAKKLKAEGNRNVFGLCANAGTTLEAEVAETFVLRCGWEQAIAATKSVVEQALFYESMLRHMTGKGPWADGLAEKVEEALTMPIDSGIIDIAKAASVRYFAGYNDGVAEELRLKTNEITRSKSDYLEGTYAVHGVEEVMSKDDIVFVIDPMPKEQDKFKEVLADGVGLTVVAISDRDTPFTTVRIPSAGDMNPFVSLCAGWNILVETGLALGIDLDKPERARKVGNEFVG
ncbi:MAG: sugar isomerase [Chitinivibrionales bacterium]|nr:sugar isomerase [Chitinivibrionales bacterium]MBD3396842.1 sugar isomerase [Chitinivibrionales bacterium]